MHPTPRESAIADYDKNFINYWSKITSEYVDADFSDSVWLTGPSSYVFLLGDQRFAVDLLIRRQKDLDALLPRLVSDLSRLSFVLITHEHEDHMCIPLMQALKNEPIRWYIPHGTAPELIEESELKEENIVFVHPGDEFTEGNLTIRAFKSPHFPEGKPELFPEVGYKIISPNGTVLIPADVRNYSYTGYPDFGKVDVCIAHLWAGNDSLNEANYLPMLRKFVDFFAKINAKRYFWCHLYDVGRTEDKMWHEGHADIADQLLTALLPISVSCAPRIGKSYSLFK